MPTTIQIDKSTKKKLFQIKLKLEEEKGSPVTYNEIVNFLINNQATNIVRRKALESFREFKGILPKETLREFQKERRKELIKEEKKAPLPDSSYKDDLKDAIYEKTNEESSEKGKQ